MLENDWDIAEVRSDTRGIATGRHASFFAISIAVHAVLIALLAILIPAVERPRNEWVLAYMVELGNGGARGAPKPESPALSASSSEIAIPRHIHKHRAKPAALLVAAPRVKAASIAPTAAVTSSTAKLENHAAPAGASRAGEAALASLGGSGSAGTGAGIGGGTGDNGPGIGNGAPGDSLAHANYGEDPLPPYPSHSRRDGEEGTVLLHVLVGSNGTVERVEIARSSGFDALDDAALDTVRERWRFVPARHDGLAAESWVLVPIRFALSEASANQ
ncbi:MAG TPA: energy transducer TonB [Candidatus Binataceae bacterium]|nr:energy transducer TonB [Candidatus Binataceae bacterium]